MPSKNWDKLNGFQIDRTVVLGTKSAAEPLNLAAISKQIGFQRSFVEAGLKDIINALTKIVRKGNPVSLSFGSLGKLSFVNYDIRFRFFTFDLRCNSNFLTMINEELRPKNEAKNSENDSTFPLKSADSEYSNIEENFSVNSQEESQHTKAASDAEMIKGIMF